MGVSEYGPPGGQATWWGTIVLLLTLGSTGAWRGRDVAVCADAPLRLQCGADEVVTGTVYGGHHAGSRGAPCHRVAGDCLDRPMLLSPQIVDCVWRQRECVLQLRASADRLKGYCSGKTIDYLTIVHFLCVPKRMIHSVIPPDVGVGVFIDAAKGYITSPQHPLVYRRGHGGTRILHQKPGYGIRIRFIVMDIRPASGYGQAGVCTDYIRLRTVGNTFDERYCGRAKGYMAFRHTDALTFNDTLLVSFSAEDPHEKHYEGFVLHFEPVPLSEMRIRRFPQRSDTIIYREAIAPIPLIESNNSASAIKTGRHVWIIIAQVVVLMACYVMTQ